MIATTTDTIARLRSGGRIWAIASVHGVASRLADLAARIVPRVQPRDSLVFLGNLIGGPPGGEPPDIAATLDIALRLRRIVLAQPGAKELIESFGEALRIITAGYRKEGKRYMTLAVGCTGGKHRSVAMGEQFTRTRYTSARGTPFEFIEHDYVSPSMVGVPPLGVAIMGHCYPGSEDWTPTEPDQLMAFGCQPKAEFHWGEQVMAFFMAHPK